MFVFGKQLFLLLIINNYIQTAALTASKDMLRFKEGPRYWLPTEDIIYVPVRTRAESTQSTAHTRKHHPIDVQEENHGPIETTAVSKTAESFKSTILTTEPEMRTSSMMPDYIPIRTRPEVPEFYGHFRNTQSFKNNSLTPLRQPFSSNPSEFTPDVSDIQGDNLSHKTDAPDQLILENKTTNFLGDSNDTDSFKMANLISLTSVNTLLSICCIVLSIIMLHFRIKAHRTKSMGLVQILYLQNGLADFFVGLGVLLQSPILFLMIWKGRETSYITVPVYISYFLTAIGVKMSMFMNCVLGVVRCINIVQPFYQINKKALTMCTISYMVIWSVIVGLDLWQFTVNIGTINQVRIVKALVMKGQPGFGLVLLTMNKDQYVPSYLAFHLGNLVQFILPTALPAVLCFVLMIVQLCHLRKMGTRPELKQDEKISKEADDSVSKARLTIFLLTSIYVSTSAVSIITWRTVHGRKSYFGSKATYEELMEEIRLATPWSELIAIYFSLSTCALICSTLTPLTLLLRGTGAASNSVRRLFNRMGRAMNCIRMTRT